MRFKSKKQLPLLKLYSGDSLLYDGLLKDVPLKEEIILQKSLEFFDDPEPCHIHRSAVRTRLIAELLKELSDAATEAPGPLLCAYVDVSGVSRCCLAGSKQSE